MTIHDTIAAAVTERTATVEISEEAAWRFAVERARRGGARASAMDIYARIQRGEEAIRGVTLRVARAAWARPLLH